MIHMDADQLFRLAEAADKLNDTEEATRILSSYNVIGKHELIEDVCICEVTDVLGQEDSLNGHSHLNITYRIETTSRFIECIVRISLYTSEMYEFNNVIKIKF